MERVKERNKKYDIIVRKKSSNYYEARISVKLGREKANIIRKGGTTVEQAVEGLLTKLYQHIEEMYKAGVITIKIDDVVAEKLSTSISKLGIKESQTIEKVYRIINLINSINVSVNNVLPLYAPPSNNILQNISQPYVVPNTKIGTIISDENSKRQTTPYTIDDVTIKWKRHLIQRGKNETFNERQLKRRTIDGYIRIINDTILPAFKKKKLLYINQVSSNDIKDVIHNSNGYDVKRLVDVTFRELFKYLVREDIIADDPMLKISKPVKPKKHQKRIIKYIEPEFQYKYIEMFEQENTDMSMLFEFLLETGCRPEERMPEFGWKNLLEEEKKICITNAVKDVVVYDEDGNKIGMERINDTLKTDSSYRDIYISDRLLEQLLKHKERQKQRFNDSVKMKKKGRKWNENEYMFLSRTFKPYSSGTLSSALPKLCDKYGLQRVSPYTLRKSYATKIYEDGVSETVIQEVLGHERICHI